MRNFSDYSEKEWNLVLLHTNDSHGQLMPIKVVCSDISSQLQLCKEGQKQIPIFIGGYAYLARLVDEFRDRNEHVLLVETGDVFCDSVTANLTKGKLFVELMNDLQYDAMVPGNHDVDYGIGELVKRMGEATFPFLAANLIDKKTNKPLLGCPTMLKTVNNLTFGFYGLTYHLTHETTSRKNIEEVKYTFCMDKIQKDIDLLRGEGADYIIVLSHLGSAVDRKLAKRVNGIDVIVGAHSHEPIPIEVINNVIMTQSTPYYTGVGVLNLQFKDKELIGVEGEILPICPKDLQPDPRINEKINQFRAKYEEELTTIVGNSTTPIIRKYKQESPAESLFGNILRRMTCSDISILPGIGFGVTIPSGEFTNEELTNLLPHGSTIYTVQLKGKDIVEALEQSIMNQIHPNEEERVGGLIQVTGVSFEYQYSEANKVSNVRVGSKPIELERSYQVVMNQLMYDGGHKYKSLLRRQQAQKWHKTDKELIIEWSKQIIVTASEEGWSIPLNDEDAKKFKKHCYSLKQRLT